MVAGEGSDCGPAGRPGGKLARSGRSCEGVGPGPARQARPWALQAPARDPPRSPLVGRRRAGGTRGTEPCRLAILDRDGEREKKGPGSVVLAKEAGSVPANRTGGPGEAGPKRARGGADELAGTGWEGGLTSSQTSANQLDPACRPDDLADDRRTTQLQLQRARLDRQPPSPCPSDAWAVPSPVPLRRPTNEPRLARPRTAHPFRQHQFNPQHLDVLLSHPFLRQQPQLFSVQHPQTVQCSLSHSACDRAQRSQQPPDRYPRPEDFAAPWAKPAPLNCTSPASP